MVRDIPLSIIRVGNRVRGGRVREQCMPSLIDSIKEIGLQTPITVRRDDVPTGYNFAESYMLVAGLHRLEACRRLGMENIRAIVVELSEVDCKLWEIDENLARADLTELERGEHLRERKKQYLIKHPETARGTSQANAAHIAMGHNVTVRADSAPTFVDDTVAKTGLGKTAVKAAIRRAEKIDPQVRDEIRDIPEISDSGVELDALAIAKVGSTEQGCGGGSQERRIQ
jgi:ParB/RepB/Spo0J family partition protein